MNCDELLQCGDVPEVIVTTDQALQTKKERLYSLAACGKTKQYLGAEVSVEQIQQMSTQNIEKYYSRYEAQLGARMVKSVGQTVLSLYTKLVSRFAPVYSEQDFMFDLTQDPVLTKSLENIGCDLYYRFGSLLAPLTMGLITLNHINFYSIKDERAGESTGECGDPTSDFTGDPTNNPPSSTGE